MQRLLAERLRVIRARKGLSLSEAAAITGVTRDTISGLERGKRHPYMPTLSKLAQGYGVPVEGLLVLEAEDQQAEGAEEPVPLDEVPEAGLSAERTQQSTRRAREDDVTRGFVEDWTRFINEWAGDLEEWAYGFHKGADPALLDEREFFAFVGGLSTAAEAYGRAKKTVEPLVRQHEDEDLAKAWRRLSRAFVAMATPGVEQRLGELEPGELPDDVIYLPGLKSA
jgi:transcriptional regulator with XRE-family HTH domain